MKHSHNASPLAISLLTLAISSGLHAQEANWDLEEVVVTAQKRAQSSQDVPIALSAFTGDMIKQAGATDFKGLTNITPGFSVTGGSDAFPRSYIRGIGSNDTGIGADPSIGVYIDGIYAARNGGALTDLMDIARVEVLKGPQGTLFGRNSIGGAISIITERPSEVVSGRLSLDLGNYNNRHAKGLINIPLIEDSLFMRASASVQKRDGWQENIVDGNKGFSRDRATGNLKFTWLATDSIEVNFSNSWNRYDEMSGYSDNLIAPAVPLNPLTQDLSDRKAVAGNWDLLGLGNHRVPIEPTLERSLRQHSLTVDWDITDDISLSSLSSYRTFETTSASDYDGTEYFVANNEESVEFNESISQEFRLNGATDKLDWFVGASASHERNTMDFTISFADLGALAPTIFGGPMNFGQPFYEDSHVSSSTDSYAIYGDATWHLNERLNLTFGARYSIDEKTIDYNNPIQTHGAAAFGGGGFIMAAAHQFVDSNGIANPELQKRQDEWKNFSPRLVLDYALTDDAMIYISATKGYKSGGFNTYPTPDIANGLVVTPAATESFDPELATNIELGIKSTWFDNRLLLNASAFSLDYEDLQVRQINNAVVQIKNAGKASNKGLELELKYHLTPQLTLLANATWMDAEYKEYTLAGQDISGTPLLFSPDFSGNIAVDYSLPITNIGELRTYVSYAYKDKHLYQEGFEQDSYGTLDARISLLAEDDRWELALYGNNLMDKSYITNYVGQTSTIGFVSVYRNAPRTFGASINYKF